MSDFDDIDQDKINLDSAPMDDDMFGDMDFDDLDGIDPKPDDRSPIAVAFSTFKSEVKDELTSTSTYGDFLNKVLPDQLSGYKYAADDAVMNVNEGLSDLGENRGKEVSNLLGELGLNKIQSAFNSKYSGDAYREKSTEAQIEDRLAEVFSENEERERAAEERHEKIEELKMSEAKGAHIESLAVSRATVAELKNLNAFHNSITYQYQRANLETGLRAYETSKKQLKAYLEYSEANQKMLKAIVLNTSLPDSRKTRNSESLMGSITGGAKDGFLEGFTNDGGFSKTLGNLTSKKINNFVGGILDKKEQYNALINSGASPMELGMSIASGLVVDSGMSLASHAIKKSGVLTSKRVLDGASKMDMRLDTFKQDATNQARTLATAKDGDGLLKSSFRSVLKEFLPGQEFDDGVFGGVRLKAVNTQDAVIRAQTVVIPTLLSKILVETIAARTGEIHPQLRYDYSTSRFKEGPGRVVSSITRLEKKFNRVDNLNQAAEQAELLLSNGSKAELAGLSESLVNAGIQSVGRAGEIVTLKDFLASSAFTNLPPDLRQTIAMKLEGQEERVYRSIRKMKSTTAVPLNVIKQLVQNQQHAPLLDKGILVERDGLLTIDEKAYTKWLNATQISNFLNKGDTAQALQVGTKKTADVERIMAKTQGTKAVQLSAEMAAQYGVDTHTQPTQTIDLRNPTKNTSINLEKKPALTTANVPSADSTQVMEGMRDRITAKMGDMVFDQHIKDGRAGLNKLVTKFGIKTQGIPITNDFFADEVIDTVRGITPETIAKSGKEKIDNLKNEVLSAMAGVNPDNAHKTVTGVATNYAKIAKRVFSTLYGKKLLDVDIYTETSENPVLYFNKISSGEYSTETANIRSMDDVLTATSNIYDKAGNIVISSTELKNGLFTRDGSRLKKGIAGIFGKINHISRRLRQALVAKPLEMLGFDMSTKGGRGKDLSMMAEVMSGFRSLKGLHGRRTAHQQDLKIAEYRKFAGANNLILPELFNDAVTETKERVLTYVDHLSGKFVKVIPGIRPPDASTIGFMENGEFTALGDKASSIKQSASPEQVKKHPTITAHTLVKRNRSKRYVHRNTEAGYTENGLYISTEMAAENRRRMQEDDGSILGSSAFASRQIGADGKPPELRGPTRVRRASQMLYEGGAMSVEADTDFEYANAKIRGFQGAIKDDLGNWIKDPDMKSKANQKGGKTHRFDPTDRITDKQHADISKPLDKRSHKRFSGNDDLVADPKIRYDNDQITHTNGLTTLVKRSADDSRLTVQLPDSAMSSEQVRDLIESNPLDQTNKLSYVFKTPNINIDNVSSGPNINDPDDELGILAAREIRIKRYEVAKESFDLFHKQAMHDKWKRVIDRLRWARETARFVNLGIDTAKATIDAMKTQADIDILQAKIAILTMRWRVNPAYTIEGLDSTSDIIAATSMSTLGQILAELRNNREHEQARWSNVAASGGGWGNHPNQPPPLGPGQGNGWHTPGSPHYRNGPGGNNYGWRETARQRLARNRRNRNRRYNGDDEDASFDRNTWTQAAANTASSTWQAAKDGAVRLAIMAMITHKTMNTVDQLKQDFLPDAANALLAPEDALKETSMVDKAYQAVYDIPNFLGDFVQRGALNTAHYTKNKLSDWTGIGDNEARREADRIAFEDKIQSYHDDDAMTDKERHNYNIRKEIDRKEKVKKILSPAMVRLRMHRLTYKSATDMYSKEGARARKHKSLKLRKRDLDRVEREYEELVEIHVTSREGAKVGQFGLLQKDSMAKAAVAYLKEIKANPNYITSANLMFKAGQYFIRDLFLGTSKPQQLYNQMRVVQYGFAKATHHVDILKFEKYLESSGFFYPSRGEIHTNMAKLNPVTLGIIFGIKEGVHMDNFLSWYENRYLPITKHQRQAMYAINGTVNLSDYSNLTTTSKIQFLAACRFNRVFDISDDNPFNTGPLESVELMANQMWNSLNADLMNERRLDDLNNPASPKTDVNGAVIPGSGGPSTTTTTAPMIPPNKHKPMNSTLESIKAQIRKISDVTAGVDYVKSAAAEGTVASLAASLKLKRSLSKAYQNYKHGGIMANQDPADMLLQVGVNQHLISNKTALAKDAWTIAEAARKKGDMGGLRASLAKYKERRVSPEMTLRVIRAIDNAAMATGLDPRLLRNVAYIESGLDPRAENIHSTAKGVFQFLTDTWKGEYTKKNRKKFGIGKVTEFNPEANSMLAANYIAKNVAKLEAITGRPITAGQAYTILFMGPGGSRQLYRDIMRNPNGDAVTADTERANANTDIFYFKPSLKHRTFRQVMDELDRRAVVGNEVPWLHMHYPLQPHEDGYFKVTTPEALEKEAIKFAEHQKLEFEDVHTMKGFKNKQGTVTISKSGVYDAYNPPTVYDENEVAQPDTFEAWERKQTYQQLIRETPDRGIFHTDQKKALESARKRMAAPSKGRQFSLTDINGIGAAKGQEFKDLVDSLRPGQLPRIDPLTNKPYVKTERDHLKEAWYQRFIDNDPRRHDNYFFRGSKAEQAYRGARAIVKAEYTDHALEYTKRRRKEEVKAKVDAKLKVNALIKAREKSDLIADRDLTGDTSIPKLLPGFLTMNKSDKYKELVLIVKDNDPKSRTAIARRRLFRQMILLAPIIDPAERSIDRALRGAEIIEDNKGNPIFRLPQHKGLGTMSEMDFMELLKKHSKKYRDTSTWDLSSFTQFAIDADKMITGNMPTIEKTQELIEELTARKAALEEKYGDDARYELLKIGAKLSSLQHTLKQRAAMGVKKAKALAINANEQIIQPSIENAKIMALRAAAKAKELKDTHMFTATEAKEKALSVYKKAEEMYQAASHDAQGAYHAATPAAKEAWKAAKETYGKAEEVFEVARTKAAIIARQEAKRFANAADSAVSYGMDVAGDVRDQFAEGGALGNLTSGIVNSAGVIKDLTLRDFNKLGAAAQVEYVAAKSAVMSQVNRFANMTPQEFAALNPLQKQEYREAIAKAKQRAKRFMTDVEYRATKFTKLTAAQVAKLSPKLRKSYLRAMMSAGKHAEAAKGKVRDYMRYGLSSFKPLTQEEYARLSPQERMEYLKQKKAFENSSTAQLAQQRFESGTQSFQNLTATQYAQLSSAAKVLYNKSKQGAQSVKDATALGAEKFVELTKEQYDRLRPEAQYAYDVLKEKIMKLRGGIGTAANYTAAMSQNTFSNLSTNAQATYSDALSSYDAGVERLRIKKLALLAKAREKLQSQDKLTTAEYAELSPAEKAQYDKLMGEDKEKSLIQLAQDRAGGFVMMSQGSYARLSMQAKVAYLEQKQKAVSLGQLTKAQAMNGINTFATLTKHQVDRLTPKAKEMYFAALNKAQRLGLVARQGLQGAVSPFMPLLPDQVSALQPAALTSHLSERASFYASTMSDVVTAKLGQAQNAAKSGLAVGQAKAQSYADKLNKELANVMLTAGPNSPAVKKLKANILALKGNVLGIAYNAMDTITNPESRRKLIAALREQAAQLAVKIGPTSDIVNALRNKANRLAATLGVVGSNVASSVKGALGALSPEQIARKLAKLQREINFATNFYGANHVETQAVIAQADELRDQLDSSLSTDPLDQVDGQNAASVPTLEQVQEMMPTKNAVIERGKMRLNSVSSHLSRLIAERGIHDPTVRRTAMELRTIIASLRRAGEKVSAENPLVASVQVQEINQAISATMQRMVTGADGMATTIGQAMETAKQGFQVGPLVSEVEATLGYQASPQYNPSGMDYRPDVSMGTGSGPLVNIPAYYNPGPVTVKPDAHGPLTSVAPTPTSDLAAIQILAQIRNSMSTLEMNSGMQQPVVVDVKLNNNAVENAITVEDVAIAALEPVLNQSGGMNQPTDLARGQIFSSLTPTV